MTLIFKGAMRLGVVAGCLAAATLPASATVIENGAFSDGFTGYDVRRCSFVCVDDGTDSTEIVEGAGGDPFLALRAPSFIFGAGQIEVSQSVTITPLMADLSFDVGLLSDAPDAVDATSTIEDYFTLLLRTSTDIYSLFRYDVTGAREAPTNTLPGLSIGETAISNMPDAISSYRFAADLSQFTGETLTLIFTTVSRGDGRVTEFGVDNIAFSGAGITPVPLPAGGALLVVSLATFAGLRRRQTARV